jgi:Zn-dependent protease with chaperone function
MRSKAVFASFLTISMMSLFILILLSPFLAAAGASMAEGAAGPLLGIGFAVLLTVLINVVLWFVSPWIMDLVNRWAYRCRDMPLEELGQYRPAVAQFVYAVCQRHNVKVPTLKLIDDMNPTAYCYGSTANRARLVVTRGLLHYLDDEELKAVYAHELGHIIHRDFIVMTIASTLLSILWQIYVTAKSFRGRASHADHAALTGLRRCCRVRSMASFHLSERASARSWTMRLAEGCFHRAPGRFRRTAMRLLQVASTTPLPTGRPSRRASA